MLKLDNTFLEQIGGATAAPSRELCPKCNRSRQSCYCKFTVPIETRARFLILMHPKEFKRQRTGTGRVTHQSLPNSKIIVSADFNGHAYLLEQLRDPSYFPMLLFPHADAANVSGGFSSALRKQIPLILILDATWSSARKMLRSSGDLISVPKISFDFEGKSRFAIKRQPNAKALSTIESAHRLLDLLDKTGLENLEGKHHTLLATLDAIVDFQISCAKNPELPSHRIPSKNT